jgi:nuclear transport factor 2 (NTF2) superfamily protein
MGRMQISQFLKRKWANELEYRRVNELWTCAENRIALRFTCEYRDARGVWHRSCGNESWEFDGQGLITQRYASVADVVIAPGERKLLWRLGRRPDDHPGLTSLGL